MWIDSRCNWRELAAYSFSSQRRLEHVLLLPILQPSALALVSANENLESKLVGETATRSEGAKAPSSSAPPGLQLKNKNDKPLIRDGLSQELPRKKLIA